MHHFWATINAAHQRGSIVARMERSGMRENMTPDFASLHPGYKRR